MVFITLGLSVETSVKVKSVSLEKIIFRNKLIITNDSKSVLVCQYQIHYVALLCNAGLI